MADEEDLKNWYSERAKTIHERVTVHDLLRRNGISLRHTGDREEQFSCPFHGKDEKPSARAYPNTPRSPSHVWCYVCRERWDVIALWKKYHGEDKKFHAVLSELEKYANITPPPAPEGGRRAYPSSNADRERYDTFYQACERRLIDVRTDYERFDDMQGFLLVGSVLDKLSYQVSEGLVGYKEATAVLQKLLKKVGDRVRGVTSSPPPHS